MPPPFRQVIEAFADALLAAVDMIGACAPLIFIYLHTAEAPPTYYAIFDYDAFARQ